MSWRTRDYAKLKGEEVILGGQGKERAVTVLWDDPEGWYGEGGGRRVQDGEHGIPVADSFRCLAKVIQYCKV